MNQSRYPADQAIKVSALLVCCTLLGLAGTDLVLPAVPILPESLGGTVAQGQLVLATFAAGTGLGLVLFGELGARFDHGRLLLVSLVCYGVISVIASQVAELQTLITWRFFQGMSASCAAVIAPGMIREMFPENRAVRVLGLLGSIESLAPAIAPIIGVWLLSVGGWDLSFEVTAILALGLAAITLSLLKIMPGMHWKTTDVELKQLHSGYLRLLKNRNYMTQSLSHAALVGGLLVFVFGAPVVIVNVLGGSISDFIIMQVCGIATFIVCANFASNLVARYGSVKTIWGGTVLSLFGIFLLAFYAITGGQNPLMLWLFFVPFNMGLGFRGPPAFYQALVATEGDDARGSALLILLIMLVTAAGTAAAAPWLSKGLFPLSVFSFAIVSLSLAFLAGNTNYRRLPRSGQG